MTKTLIFLKKSNLAAALILCGLLAACNNANQAKVNDAGKVGPSPTPNPNEKLGLAPAYEEAQFATNQWIEWKRTNSSGQTECVRWKLTGIYGDGITLETNVHTKCEVAPTSITGHILFKPVTGDVPVHFYRTVQNQEFDGDLKGKNIFAYIYGNPKQLKETYFTVTQTIDGAKYPGFELGKSKGRIYLNQPGSPFHAMAIQFSQREEDKQTWTYQLHKSSPVIQSLPKDEKP